MKCIFILVFACFGLVIQSPWPSRSYDLLHGEGSLINPVKNAVDSRLSELCESFGVRQDHTRQDAGLTH